MRTAIAAWVAQLRSYRCRFLLLSALTLALVFLALQAETLHAMITNRVATSLATRIPRVDLGPSSRIAGMIVLGGGMARVREAIDLSERFPAAPIILSGVGAKERALAEARLRNLIFDDRAGSTYENAVYSRDWTGAEETQCWLLITSATHMPRAVAVFRTAGIPIAPWPVFDMPRTAAKKTKVATYEVKALVAYRLLGRTDAFYPARGATCRPDEATQPVLISAAAD